MSGDPRVNSDDWAVGVTSQVGAIGGAYFAVRRAALAASVDDTAAASHSLAPSVGEPLPAHDRTHGAARAAPAAGLGGLAGLAAAASALSGDVSSSSAAASHSAHSASESADVHRPAVGDHVSGASAELPYAGEPDDAAEDDDAWVEEEAAAFADDFAAQRASRLVGTVTTRTLQRVDSIWDASRRGDLVALRRYVEAEGVDVNSIDDFDGSPLYYASLCGHEEAVKYLLDKGANADTASWDGERCHYAALTDAIRRLLRSYEAVGAQRGAIFGLLYRICSTVTLALHTDVCLAVERDGTAVHAHKWLLAARSPFFRAAFGPGGRWQRKRYVHLTDGKLCGPALRAVISFLYTERLMYPRGQWADVLAVAQALQLKELAAFLRRHLPAAVTSGEDLAGVVAHNLAERNYAQGSLPPSVAAAAAAASGGAGAGAGSATSAGWYSAAPGASRPAWEGQGPLSGHHVRDDLWHHVLFAGVLPPELVGPENGDDDGASSSAAVPSASAARGAGVAPKTATASSAPSTDSSAMSSTGSTGSSSGGWFLDNGVPYDLAIEAQEGLLFRCHKAVVSTRSPYFASQLAFQADRRAASAAASGTSVSAASATASAAASVTSAAAAAASAASPVASGAGASEPPDGASRVHCDAVSPYTLASVLQYLYTDSLPAHLPSEFVLEALYAADLLLVPDLKPLLVGRALEHISGSSLADLWRAADLCGLGRLTAACADYAAARLQATLADPQFAALVRESAAAIRDRHAFDSVPVLDELLTAIARRHGGAGSGSGAAAGVGTYEAASLYSGSAAGGAGAGSASAAASPVSASGAAGFAQEGVRFGKRGPPPGSRSSSAGAGGPSSNGFRPGDFARWLQDQQRLREGRPLRADLEPLPEARAAAIASAAAKAAVGGAGTGAANTAAAAAAAAAVAAPEAEERLGLHDSLDMVVAWAREAGYHLRSAAGLLLGPDAGVSTR